MITFAKKIYPAGMWKPLVAALMLISIALQSLNRVMIVGGYYASAYTKNCENKTKPELKCGGRCQMMKKLNAENKNDQQAPSARSSEHVLSSKSFFAQLLPLYTEWLEHNSNYTLSQLPLVNRKYFHPPGVRLIIFS
jgi:hypothetical protein